MSTGSVVDISKRTPCPFINDPFDDCYCSAMDSRRTEAAMYFCGGHFEECEIYLKNTAQKAEREGQ